MPDRTGARSRLQPTTPAWRWAALLLVLLAWWLPLGLYPREELGLDGYLSVGLALTSLERTLAFLARDVHPPLYYLLLDGWLAAVGPSSTAARMLSTGAAAVTLALAVRLGSRVSRPAAALVGAALLLLAPAFLAAGATARDFALGLALSTASVLLWQRFMTDAERQHGPEKAPARLSVGIYALVTALALLTWYFHALFVVVQGASLVATGVARSRLRRRPGEALDGRGLKRTPGVAFPMAPLAALVGGSAIALPWMIVAAPALIERAVDRRTFGGQPDAAVAPIAFASEVAAALTAPGPAGTAAGAAALSIALAVLGLARLRRRRELLAAGAIVGLLLGLIATYVLAGAWLGGGSVERYLLVILPWMTLAHAAALSDSSEPDRAPRWAPALALIVVLVGAWGAAPALAGPKPGTVDPLVHLAEEVDAADAILFLDHARTGRYVARQRGAAPAAALHVAGPPFLRESVEGFDAAPSGPPPVGRARLWLGVDGGVDPGAADQVRDRLLAGRVRTETVERDGARLELWQPAPAPSYRTAGRLFGGALELEAWAVDIVGAPPSRAARRGDPMVITLRWRAPHGPQPDATRFVHLVDEGGQRIAQDDGAPRLGLAPTSIWGRDATIVESIVLRAPLDARGGLHWLLVGFYRAEGRLGVDDGTDAARLGPILIE